jgi:hypothetical protein
MALTRTPILTLSLACTLLAAAATAHTPVHKTHPKPYSKGTSEMAGGRLQFGQTYTYNDNGGPINIEIIKAAYSPGGFSASASSGVNADNAHKLLMIYFRVKNSSSSDTYLRWGQYFQLIDSNGNTITDSGDQRRLSATTPLGQMIKPGQGIDDLVDAIVVPAQGPITKIILQYGRMGTKDQVTRFDLGTAPNVIAPLPAPYANPSDPTTLLPKIKAAVGTTYHAGGLDLALDSVSLAPGPIGNYTAASGKQFLVAKVTLSNPGLGQWYVHDDIEPTLETDDDQITDHNAVKADHDDDVEGRQLQPGDSLTYRIIIQVPTDATLKTLSLVDNMGDSGMSSALVYDVSGVK